MGPWPGINQRLRAHRPTNRSRSILHLASWATLLLVCGGCGGHGASTAPPTPASAVLSASTLSFPSTPATTTASPLTLTVTNAGQTALSVSFYSLGDTTNFAVTSSCTSALLTNASCSFSIVFRPQTQGAFNTTLILTDNSGPTGRAQQTIPLSGVGAPPPIPQAVLSSSALIFPQIISNATATQTLTLSNPGTGPLAIAGIAIAGANASNFALAAGGCGASLAAGASCTEIVQYVPKLASAGDTATVVFTDNANNQAGATQAATLSGTALAEVDSVTNFGDSITCGFYAQPNDGAGLVYSNEGYAGLFDTFVAVPSSNRCRQGDTAADMSRLWVPTYSSPTFDGHQLYTVMIGTNDAYRYGVPWQALSNYTAEVGASLAWLSLPADAKVLANTITVRHGSWSTDAGYGLPSFGLQSSDPGASLTFSVHQAQAGHNLYVVYHVWSLPNTQAGMATLAVDGIDQATVDESTGAGAGFFPVTENGSTDSYLLQVVPLGAPGDHTITFRSTGAAGTMVSLLWAGVPQTTYSTVDGAPRVLVGAIPNSPSGNQTYSADVYNISLRSLVSSLVADGMNITVVPSDQALDPNTDFSDLLHPNSAGHRKLASVFETYR